MRNFERKPCKARDRAGLVCGGTRRGGTSGYDYYLAYSDHGRSSAGSQARLAGPEQALDGRQ